MNKYFIMVNGQQMGPFTSEEIVSKGFSTDSYVYNKTLGDWKMISEIPDFFQETNDPLIKSRYQNIQNNISSNKGNVVGPKNILNSYPKYASWGSRAGAYLLDVVFLTIFFVIFFGLVGVVFGTDEETMLAAYIPYFIVLFIYYAGLESGSKQGTWGKQIVGLKVIDATTQLPVSFGQASGRFISRIIISIIPIIGFVNYLSPLWTERKQAGHDQMASCVIIEK
jgi:uncharacterized RDD family membrane protein YckC